MLPKEEPTGYAAKKEELVPAGEEGREPAKSASEYHPAVQQKVGELSDTNLRQLAKAHGLNPDEYDFNARDDHRHRVERDQLVKEITEQMGEDEKINLGRAAEQLRSRDCSKVRTTRPRSERRERRRCSHAYVAQSMNTATLRSVVEHLKHCRQQRRSRPRH